MHKEIIKYVTLLPTDTLKEDLQFARKGELSLHHKEKIYNDSDSEDSSEDVEDEKKKLKAKKKNKKITKEDFKSLK